MKTLTAIEQHLGDKAEFLLGFNSPKISKDRLHLPGPDFVDRLFVVSDRSIRVLTNPQRLCHGRSSGTGYLSILPVDQGIGHSAGASFAKNPEYCYGGSISKLATEGGCNAVACAFAVLGSVARKCAHKIPFLGKIKHDELLTCPNWFDRVMFGTVMQACDIGAVAAGAIIYLGSKESTRQIVERSQAFALPHEYRSQRHKDWIGRAMANGLIRRELETASASVMKHALYRRKKTHKDGSDEIYFGRPLVVVLVAILVFIGVT